jgi:hypothetical protein
MHNQEQLRLQADAALAGKSMSEYETIPGQYWQGHSDMSPEEVNNLRRQQLYMGPLISALQGGVSFIQPVRTLSKLLTTAMESEGIKDTSKSYDDSAAVLTGNELPAGQATDPADLDVIQGEDVDPYNFDEPLGIRRGGNGSNMNLAAFIDADRNRRIALSGAASTKSGISSGSSGGKSGGRRLNISLPVTAKPVQNLASDRLRKITTAVQRAKLLSGMR